MLPCAPCICKFFTFTKCNASFWLQTVFDALWLVFEVKVCCFCCFLKPNHRFRYLTDACFTSVIIQTLCILLWFTLWSIVDILILPGDTYRSYIVSLFSGYVVVIAVFFVQSPVYQLTYDAYLTSPLLALAVEDIYKVVATIATLNVWRGLWGLIKDFVFTNDSGVMLALSYHAFGFVVMIIMGVSK